MKHIESQLNTVLSFRNVELKDIDKHILECNNRIALGIEKMKKSKLFTDDEITHISSYANKLLSARATEYRKILIAEARKEFVF